MSETIRFTLDGETVEAEKGLTIWEVANGRGLVIPHLCHKPAKGYGCGNAGGGSAGARGCA